MSNVWFALPWASLTWRNKTQRICFLLPRLPCCDPMTPPAGRKTGSNLVDNFFLSCTFLLRKYMLHSMYMTVVTMWPKQWFNLWPNSQLRSHPPWLHTLQTSFPDIQSDKRVNTGRVAELLWRSSIINVNLSLCCCSTKLEHSTIAVSKHNTDRLTAAAMLKIRQKETKTK